MIMMKMLQKGERMEEDWKRKREGKEGGREGKERKEGREGKEGGREGRKERRVGTKGLGRKVR